MAGMGSLETVSPLLPLLELPARTGLHCPESDVKMATPPTTLRICSPEHDCYIHSCSLPRQCLCRSKRDGNPQAGALWLVI